MAAFNGVGGKCEPGEDALGCMVRECQEETSLSLPRSAWLYVATIKEPETEIFVFTAVHTGEHTDAIMNDHEEIEWFPYQSLPESVISNLHFLVPMAHEMLRGHNASNIILEYLDEH
jgi:ADP-ribose pyrophosphatase